MIQTPLEAPPKRPSISRNLFIRKNWSFVESLSHKDFALILTSASLLMALMSSAEITRLIADTKRKNAIYFLIMELAITATDAIFCTAKSPLKSKKTCEKKQ
jgi:hypothetical protein